MHKSVTLGGIGPCTMKYKTVIGLEIHAQLATTHKMFSMEGATYGAPPNTQTSPTTLAHPGTLPSLNGQAVDYAIKMGIACGAAITEKNYFDRKSYLYPDLPKGFQITQHRTPLCRNGMVVIEQPDGRLANIRIERIHLEEDTGKTMHAPNGRVSLIDFNRAGQPLIEIVTMPDMTSPEEAGLFVTEIQRLVRYLGISNGHMEEGALRCDANVSIMLSDSSVQGNKVELKNMNSVRHVRLGIAEEVRRQVALREAGKVIVSETRSYNPQTGHNDFQRSKEGLSGYRYITEANVSPFTVAAEEVEKIKATMPILPRQLAKKFREVYGLSKGDVTVLVDDKETGLFFDEVCQHTKHYKVAANWMMGPVRSYMNMHKLTWFEFPLSPKLIAKLTDMVTDGWISFSTASQQLFPQLIQAPASDPMALIQAQQLNINDEQQLIAWIDEVLEAYADKVQAYHEGKRSLFGLFMGEVMRVSRRKANPKKTAKLLQQKLDALK